MSYWSIFARLNPPPPPMGKKAKKQIEIPRIVNEQFSPSIARDNEWIALSLLAKEVPPITIFRILANEHERYDNWGSVTSSKPSTLRADIFRLLTEEVNASPEIDKLVTPALYDVWGYDDDEMDRGSKAIYNRVRSWMRALPYLKEWQEYYEKEKTASSAYPDPPKPPEFPATAAAWPLFDIKKAANQYEDALFAWLAGAPQLLQKQHNISSRSDIHDKCITWAYEAGEKQKLCAKEEQYKNLMRVSERELLFALSQQAHHLPSADSSFEGREIRRRAKVEADPRPYVVRHSESSNSYIVISQDNRIQQVKSTSSFKIPRLMPLQPTPDGWLNFGYDRYYLAGPEDYAAYTRAISRTDGNLNVKYALPDLKIDSRNRRGSFSFMVWDKTYTIPIADGLVQRLSDLFTLNAKEIPLPEKAWLIPATVEERNPGHWQIHARPGKEALFFVIRGKQNRLSSGVWNGDPLIVIREPNDFVLEFREQSKGGAQRECCIVALIPPGRTLKFQSGKQFSYQNGNLLTLKTSV